MMVMLHGPCAKPTIFIVGDASKIFENLNTALVYRIHEWGIVGIVTEALLLRLVNKQVRLAFQEPKSCSCPRVPCVPAHKPMQHRC